MTTETADHDFWKRKILAFLHDPPCKPMDIGLHEKTTLSFVRQALKDFSWDEKADTDLLKALKDADYMASAADRVTFPTGGKAPARFTGKHGETFRHPLGGPEPELVMELPPTAHEAESLLQSTIASIKTRTPRQMFFFLWRRWMEESVKLGQNHAESLAYFPADTRIPDHTVWTHMSVTSALQACRNDNQQIAPAFLVFQLGPVQEFIAAARSTRDLWSGSYLLSWLTAHALKAVTDRLGPDNIIFPALRGQGIFDVLNRDLYKQMKYSDGKTGETTLWERMYPDGDKADKASLAKILLNPTLPNRFLALVPAHAATEIARAVELAVQKELSAISVSCWQAFAALATAAGESPDDGWQKRWNAQVAAWSQISWSVMPWEHDIAKGLADFAKLPVNRTEKPEDAPASILQSFHDFATKTMPPEDRDGRYYKDSGNTRQQLKSSGFLWSANIQASEQLMAARRNTREFAQFATDQNQDGARKDILTGKEEVIGSEVLWASLKNRSDCPFKEKEGPYGALTIIKRLWCRKESGYLLRKLDIPEELFNQTLGFDSAQDVAAKNDDDTSPYVAVIAMDGDEMGKWISGAKTPRFLDQLAPSACKYFNDKLPPDLRRPVSPSYHMQFSEALANFANHLAGSIVRHYRGQLVYAGGDDVLAMVPADKALRCAQTLRAVFRGRKKDLPESEKQYPEFEFAAADGFMTTKIAQSLIVPGPNADVSVGIAIGHYKHPLQALVREAQAAEKRAKHEFGRAAFAVSLLKRGGETIHWGGKWDSPGLKLYETYCSLRGHSKAEKERSPISGKFPYALATLLNPYALDKGEFVPNFVPRKVIEQDLEQVLERQIAADKQTKQNIQDTLSRLSGEYLAHLASEFAGQGGKNGRKSAYTEFINLFLTAAFIERSRGEEE